MPFLSRRAHPSSRQEKPKVLFLIPSLRFGGTERQVVEMALLLREKYNPAICTIYPQNRFPELKEQRIKVLSLNKKTGKLYNLPCFLKFVFLASKEKPAIIHSFLMFANLYACGVRLLLRPKNVITSTRINIDFSKCYGGNRFTYYLFKNFSRFHVVNTRYNADVLVNEMSYRESQLYLIENMVDTDRFAYNSCDKKFPGAVYPARIEERKNQLILIEAMNILEQKKLLPEGFQLFLVGEKNDKQYSKKVFKAIREYNLEKSIILVDPTITIERYYSLYSFLVFPSSWEGLSNTILEAMASGLPVVCSHEANIPGLIDEGVNGYLFPAHSPEACAESLHKMINTDAFKRKEMGKINRQRIEKRFTRQIFKEKLEALYESCLSR
jgi:glycosyltransferase involved in cell wall biosynthesis